MHKRFEAERRGGKSDVPAATRWLGKRAFTAMTLEAAHQVLAANAPFLLSWLLHIEWETRVQRHKFSRIGTFGGVRDVFVGMAKLDG